MITKEQAQNLRSGQILHNLHHWNAHGQPVRCRVNGKCQTWKTRPDEWKLPVKYGLKQCFYITPSNAGDWEIA